MQLEFSLRGAVIMTSCLVLAACGGGGGSDDGGGSSNTRPSVDAGAPQSVNEFEAVTLGGSVDIQYSSSNVQAALDRVSGFQVVGWLER